MLDLVDELAHRAFVDDAQEPIADCDLQPARGERPGEYHLARVLADVDEAARAGQDRAEFADVQVAVTIRLRQSEHRHIESAAIVEIELVRLVDHRLRVGRHAEIESAGRHPADHARFGGERDRLQHALLGRHMRDAFRHADAEVDDIAFGQLHQGAPCDDLALAQRHRRDRRQRHAHRAGVGLAIAGRERLRVILRFLGHDDAIDQDPRHLHLARIQRAIRDCLLDLHDHDAARVMRRHRDRQRLECERLFLHRHVAGTVGRRAADDRHVDRPRLVEQVLPAVDLHQRHHVLACQRIDLAAAEARIDERAEAHRRQQSRLARRSIAKQLADHALRQVVRLDQVVDGEFLQRWHQSPVPADDALDQPRMAEVVQTTLLAVALPCGVHQRQVARQPGRREALFQRHRDVLRKADADKAAGGNGIAVANALHRLCRRNNLIAHHFSPGVRSDIRTFPTQSLVSGLTFGHSFNSRQPNPGHANSVWSISSQRCLNIGIAPVICEKNVRMSDLTPAIVNKMSECQT